MEIIKRYKGKEKFLRQETDKLSTGREIDLGSSDGGRGYLVLIVTVWENGRS